MLVPYERKILRYKINISIDLAWTLNKDMCIVLYRDYIMWSRLAFLLAELPPTIALLKKTPADSSLIYADLSGPTPDTS